MEAVIYNAKRKKKPNVFGQKQPKPQESLM